MSRPPRRHAVPVAALATCLLALALVPAARAWNELPPYAVPGRAAADCLRSAGPGQLALLGRVTRTSAATELLDVAAGGIAPRVATTLGRLEACAEAATADGAAPLLAGWVLLPGRRGASALRVAPPGAPPTTLRVVSHAFPSGPGVAVAPNGAAVVAWSETTFHLDRPFDSRSRVLAAVRPAGGAPFGPIAVLDANAAGEPAVGIDAAGDATVAWMGDASSRSSGNDLASAEVASAPAGGRFGAPEALVRSSGDAIALAVAPNGRALLAADAGDLTGAWERSSATGSFSVVALPDMESPDELAVALAPDGGAALVVQSDSLTASLRRPGGGFGPPQQLEGNTSSVGSFAVFLGLGQASQDDSGSNVHAAIGPGGDVVVSWVEDASGIAAASVRVARGTLGGRLGGATRLGTPCRAAEATTPLLLRDGRLGIAWTENARVDSLGGFERPHGGGRLHVATPDPAAPRPRALPPLISARVLGSGALHTGQALRLRVRCRRGPCDVRAVAPAFPSDDNGPPDGEPVAVSTTVETGRAATLRLVPTRRGSFARRRRPTRAAVALLACGPTGAVAPRLTLRPLLRRLPPPPVPRIIGLRAHRSGNAIHVTWRTSIPARSVDFYVLTRPIDFATGVVERAGHGRTRFSVTLHPQNPAHVRSISVIVDAPDLPSQRPVTVRVR
jgi:hypothetical protein